MTHVNRKHTRKTKQKTREFANGNQSEHDKEPNEFSYAQQMDIKLTDDAADTHRNAKKDASKNNLNKSTQYCQVNEKEESMQV